MPEGIQRRGDKIYVVLREPDPARPGKTKVHWHAGSTYGFDDEDSAKAWRDQRRQDIRSGKAAARDKVTVSDYLDEWLPAHVASRDLQATTAASYLEKLSYIKGHPIGGMQIQLVKPVDVRRFYTDLLTKGGKAGTGLSKRTVEYVGTILKRALRDAVTDYGLRGDSPAESVTVPRPRKAETDTWSAEEMSALIEVIRKDRYGRMFAVQSATGARRGEMLALRWGSVDLDSGWIVFSTSLVRLKGGPLTGGLVEKSLKNDQSKSVKVDNATVALLREHRKKQAEDRLKAGTRWLDEDYVFPNENGGPLNPSNLGRYWRDIVSRAGVKYCKPHALRHTHATLLLEAGVPAHVVAKRLGHKDVTTTFKVYAHVTERMEDDAADTYAGWLAGGSKA